MVGKEQTWVHPRGVVAYDANRNSAVIKLKQVDHVNHERSVLADVAGYPFITTLITSFSDHDSLYMLVSRDAGSKQVSCANLQIA